ncbi:MULTISPECIES: YkgJ family cysteine cluster protein [Methylococcus]|uniref:YkgJ family cysteine cluster protein n=1 Tax=Methylococcus capsulatus TaxID=414 RepID=A0ABZ2F9R4_METCP|nr:MULTISPECIES: YkgJ family cysteine cluster protein [Methylococcus]MDF9392697.1 YkgJ family cysteine cluster protein [Methylococcus capsulatus]
MADQDSNGSGPLSFFKAQHRAFAETLKTRQGTGGLIDGLLLQAWDSFEHNIAIQAEGQPPLACHKGCATCCTLRVTATAPEVLMIGRYVRWSDGRFKSIGIDLPARIADADAKTHGLDEAQRVALRLRCPYIENGICLIYQVRPLACRGHASYDVHACVKAAAGRAGEIPYSGPHRVVRGLVQNAMQSSLRDAGLAFGLYELNHAVCIAIQNENCYAEWLSGADVFAPAAITDVGIDEMARIYDAIQAS